MENQKIGYIIGGGLKAAFTVRLNVSSQAVSEGTFVVIKSGDWHYYGIVTDIQLGSTDEKFADERMDGRLSPALAQALHQQALYANIEVLPNLMLDVGPEPGTPAYSAWVQKIDSGLAPQPKPRPVKNIPPHHAEVYLASEGDIAEIFGKSDKKKNFIIGHTREQEHDVRIDLKKFIQRSSGIFGATGTGKSFLTRVILAGLAKYDEASLLVFDMHSEYAYSYNPPEGGDAVPGLKDKMGSKFNIVGLGRGKSAAYQGIAPDIPLEIAMSDIRTSDIEMLSKELNLRDTTSVTLSALVQRFKKNWFQSFMEMKSISKVKDEESGTSYYPDGSIEKWSEDAGIHVEAAKALHARLKRKVYELPYVVEKPATDGVTQIINALAGKKHVILSFGKHDSDLDYLFVSNILTRRIRAEWERKTNEYNQNRQKNSPPRPLVIAIEEAHKLLNREMASQTTFSTIARELRKYFVTLLIIDQRPSQIYDEVMSQLGTRISGWLGDDSDIQAVLSGLAGRDSLRGMLSRLQSGEEVLLLGPWGVPMPLPVKSRRYGEAFWRELNKVEKKRDPLKEMGF
ncbi:MAG: ATP-binding protein [Anaerolineae bacterium]|jgi:uncharacterized protein|nr:ATP-binding protein [Anaerolineae bacterium]MBT7782298.1 ATP-binding protein [Anaerolineae bacterium]